MKIKWNNVIALLLVITLIVLLFKLSPVLETLAEDFRYSCRHSGDPITGLAALGLICLTIVGVVIILSRR